MIHAKTHPSLSEPDCFGCKLAHWSVAASAMPTRGGGTYAAEQNAKERQWHREHAAYKRLVKQGYQPDTLDRVDVLESRATHDNEIALGLGAPKDMTDAA